MIPGIGYQTYYYTKFEIKQWHYFKRNPVEYIKSTDRNAYQENHLDINVNANYYASSMTFDTWFAYNPTYRFLG